MAQLSIGSFDGTGSSIVQHKPGFRPKLVKIYNVEGNCSAVWMEGMDAASMLKTVDSGAGAVDVSLVTTNGITIGNQGFVLGADGDLNASGEMIRFECYA